MSLKRIYKESILESLLLDYLKEGDLPSSDDLEADLLNYQLVHKDLSHPYSSYLDFSVERGSSSSADLNNTIIDAFSQDISVLTKEIYNLTFLNSQHYERWSNELSRLSIKANKLEQRVDNLLLLTASAAGHFSTVGDVFNDLSLVDTEVTTGHVNTEEQIVSLNEGSEQSGSVHQINTTPFTSKNISFSVVSKSEGTTYYSISGKLEDLFKTDSSSWVGKVVSSKNNSVISELKVSFDKLETVSKVILTSLSSYNTRTRISLQYSSDGYTWFLVPCSDSTQICNSVNSWNFSLLEIQFLKFIIVKSSADTNRNEYNYSFKSIKAFSNSYFPIRGDLLFSQPLYVEKDDFVQAFFKAELETCEVLPTNTSIDYYLSASIDNKEWTSWYQVIPSQYLENYLPKVINFSNLKENNNIDNEFLINSSVLSTSLIPSFDTDTFVFPNFSPSLGFINNYIEVLDSENVELIANTLSVWRNIYDPVLDLEVRKVPLGWNKDGQTYSCYFEIEDSNGQYFDFGRTTCVIDGESKTGNVFVNQGLHRFKTESINWNHIPYDRISSLHSETELREIDSLYPHNHKLIINGILYPSSFDGEKIYRGAEISGETFLTKTNLFDLEQKNSLTNFAIKEINQIEDSPVFGIVVNFNPSNTDYSYERFLIKWKSIETVSGYKYIKLKAKFNTEDFSVTPKLSSYRIKLGA